MKLHIFQKGFNYGQDGPGNRLVYHLQGCNFRCPWCANPESMKPEGVLQVMSEQLNESLCPKGAIRNHQLNREICKGCKSWECVTLHRNSQLVRSSKEVELKEILEEVKRSRFLFFDGGGVTLTGGEPTLQFEGIRLLLGELKKLGIHTAIETNGSHGRLTELAPLLDMIIVDLKSAVTENQRQVTGVSNGRTLTNIRTLAAQKMDMLVRIPLIHGFNTSMEDERAFLEFLETCDTATCRFEFLPYHEYGKKKWEQCGMEYTVEDGFVPEEIVKRLEEDFSEKGYRVVHT